MSRELKHIKKFESQSDIPNNNLYRAITENTLSITDINQMVDNCIKEVVEYFNDYIDDEVAEGNLDNIANIIRSISSEAATKTMMKMKNN